MTKLAYPFHEPRLVKIKEAMEQTKKFCLRRTNIKHFQIKPVGDLKRVEININDEKINNIFQDEKTREVYVVVPQRSNLLHCPCKWTKLVSYDEVHGFPEALGSCEILVPNEYVSYDIIPANEIKQSSYNYKDFTIAGRLDHICNDVCCCCCL